MHTQKTNAMRLLDRAKISYTTISYEVENNFIDSEHVATILHEDPNQVFKTLITQANTKAYFVFLLPANKALDLKKCAKVVGVKHIEMIHVRDIPRISGYVRGGCSPIGMKKQFITTIHESCLTYDTILFSAGRIGTQIKIEPHQLLSFLHANCADIIAA